MLNGLLPLRLAFDDDSAFEAVLTDIPLFCVGLMAMGSITFIFIMKRVNSTTLYLCTGSLLLFIAAILDLGQLLILKPMQSIQNVDLNVVSGFIVAREVGLGLSYGFLFLFVWKAVAQRPGSERRRSSKDSPQSQPHSASWTRWGLAGAGLKWFTLVLVVLIPLLQIVWRIVNSQRQYSSIYIAESTLEIVASTIFVLKIILNVLVSPSASWWPPFRTYLGLVLALVITAAMGIGNLVTFAFSETVLGRFLRAISIYTLLLYNLITLFHVPSGDRTPALDEEASLTPARSEKPKGLIIRTTDPKSVQPSQRTPSIVAVERTVPTPLEIVENARPPLRISASSRLSMLVSRVEQNEALAGVTRTISSRSSRKSLVTPATPKRPKRPDLRFDIITPVLPSTTENPGSAGEPPTTGISLTYYTMDLQNPEMASVLDGQEESIGAVNPPVYQSDEQNNPRNTSRTSLLVQPPSHRGPSFTSFEELIRQQNELDRSIAKLRLLSVDTTNLSPPEEATSNSPSPAGDTTTSAKSRPQSTLRTDSLSPHSEFSLSVFPAPPPRPESMARETRFSKPVVLRRKLPQPPISSFNQVPSAVPESPSQRGVVARLTSGGTQYDVTSFINTLTEPGDQPTAPTEVVIPSNKATTEVLRLNAARSDDGPHLDHSALHLRPMLLPSVASERRATPPLSIRLARDMSHPSPLVGPRDSSVALKPFLLGTSATSVPTSLPSSTMVPLGTRRGSRATRIVAHKSRISVPRLNTSDTLTEEVPEAFERPRRPPVVGLPDRPKA